MRFTIVNNRMALIEPSETVSPNAFADASFSFDANWRYLSVWANLEGNGIAYRMKIENGGITSDCNTNLPEGHWDIYLKGIRYNEQGELAEERITNICRFHVKETVENQVCRYRTVATSTAAEQTKFLALQALDLAKEVFRLKNSGEFRGPKGDTGATGPQGPTGAPGANGEDGYTPVRGVDYWTAADQQDIVDDVLEALPVWTGGAY